MVAMHVWFTGLRENSGEITGKGNVRPLLFEKSVFLFGRNSRVRFWARHFAVEVFNVGGWLTHGDLALEAQVDFLAVVEHIWAPAWQDSSHVGNAGVGVVRLRGALVSLPAFTTAQFWRFFESVAGPSGVSCLLVLVGSCTWLSCTVIRGLILMLSSLLWLSNCLMLLLVS